MPTPYAGREFTFTNPDGTQLRVRGYGNQFAAVFETLDGFTVVKDPQSGFYHYARVSEDGTRLEPTGLVVGACRRVGARPSQARAAGRGGLPEGRPIRDPRDRGHSPMGAATAHPQAADPAPPLDPDDEEADRGPGSGHHPWPPRRRGWSARTSGSACSCASPTFPMRSPAPRSTKYCNAAGYTRLRKQRLGARLLPRRVGRTSGLHQRRHRVPHGQVPPRPLHRPGRGVRDTGPSADPRGAQASEGGGFRLQAAHRRRRWLRQGTQRLLRRTRRTTTGARACGRTRGALAKPFAAASGRSFSDYQITSIGSELTLRTFCHENGHMICDFPDLYDYGDESSGVGDFCLMGVRRLGDEPRPGRAPI